MQSLFLAQVIGEDLPEVGLASLLQNFEEEIFVFNHELLQFGLVQPRVLELARVHFAHARPVEVLARKEAEVVRKTAVCAPMTAVGQCELAQLILLP